MILTTSPSSSVHKAPSPTTLPLRKVLVLILASDSPIYLAYKTQWQRFMNNDPRFECYFYHAASWLRTPYELSGNTLYVRCDENLHSIFKKTVLALKYFQPRFDEFDFISRPNLSSLLLFDRYAKYLEGLPRQRLIEGYHIHSYGISYASGCGFTMSPDVATLVADSQLPQFKMDDVTIGSICKANNIPLKARGMWIVNGDNLEPTFKELIRDAELFHLRVRTTERGADVENYRRLVDVLIDHMSWIPPPMEKAAIREKLLCIIPARSGSKGLPHKNIRSFRGRPLLAWSILQAQRSKYPMRIIVSTDSEEYATIARNQGAEVPFLRPAEISGDFSTDYELISHAVNTLKASEEYWPDCIVQLRPTYPTRSVAVLDACIDAFLKVRKGFDSLRTVIETDACPYKMYTMEGDELRPLFSVVNGLSEPYNRARQELPKVYHHNGCIDILNTEVLQKGMLSGTRIYPFLMDSTETNDIDTMADWEKAQQQQLEQQQQQPQEKQP